MLPLEESGMWYLPTTSTDTNNDDEIEATEKRPLIPKSHRRLAREIAEMVKQPYPNTRLTVSHSLSRPCLLLNTGTRTVHVPLALASGPYDCPADWYITGRRRADGPRCADWLLNLTERSRGYPRYTIKTLAMHLLSMFDGDYERKGVDGAEDEWVLSKWDFEPFENWKCSCGWHPQVHPDIVVRGAARNSVPKITVTRRPKLSKNHILDIPVEVLKQVLGYLGTEDIVRLGQAFKKLKDTVEEHVVIRDRELRCFVTRKHFTESCVGIGIYLSPLHQQPGSGMESEFDLVSWAAFSNLHVRKTAYGCKFSHWLPLPLSERHWDRVKDYAYGSLRQLARVGRQRGLKGRMDVLVAFMEDQITKLFNLQPRGQSNVTGLLRPSEKAVESMFFLFHLLLCVAVDKLEVVSKTNKKIKDLQADNASLKDMPSPGRMLATLLISDVETSASFLPRLLFEAVTRNVPRLLKEHPELEYLERDGAASPYRLHHTFATDESRYRGIMFLDLFQRTVRSADLDKPQSQQDGSPITSADILKARRDFFFRRHGFPPSALLATLAAELPRIMAVDSFPGLIKYMGLSSASRVDESFLAGKLRDTVRECLLRGDRTPWSLSREDGAALRLAAEEKSPLPETEYLRPTPGLSTEMNH